MVVATDADDVSGLAGLDFVAGSEHGLLNLCAIQMGAVGASFIDDAAAVGAAFHGEVHAGHVIVVRNGELGAVGGAADEDRLAGCQRRLCASKRSRLNL